MPAPRGTPDRLIGLNDAAGLLGIHPKTLQGRVRHARQTGDWSDTPKPCEGPRDRDGERRRHLKWRESDVVRFIRTRRLDP